MRWWAAVGGGCEFCFLSVRDKMWWSRAVLYGGGGGGGSVLVDAGVVVFLAIASWRCRCCAQSLFHTLSLSHFVFLRPSVTPSLPSPARVSRPSACASVHAFAFRTVPTYRRHANHTDRPTQHNVRDNSLTHLAGAQLKASRSAVDPADVPRFFGSAQNIVQLALHTANDASLVQR